MSKGENQAVWSQRGMRKHGRRSEPAEIEVPQANFQLLVWSYDFNNKNI